MDSMTDESPTPAAAEPQNGGSLADNPTLGFVPWIVFCVVAGPRTWEVASGCALLASLVLLTADVWQPLLERGFAAVSGVAPDPSRPRPASSPKILDLGTVAFFLVLVILGLFVDRHSLIVLEKYSQAISSAALGAIVVASIALGHPFTEQYARDGVPAELWHTPLFRRTMVLMSTVWAVIFGVMAILGVIAETGVAGAGSNDLLNWYIPIGLMVVGFKFNDWYPAFVERQSMNREPAARPARGTPVAGSPAS